MNLFRRLAGNIFFKLILAFVALTFVLFGVSGFILGSPNSWVAKIGGTTISYSYFTKALQADREMILASNKSQQALQYLDSSQFKSDVLGRIVNKTMVEKLHKEYGVEASRKLILEAVATNPNFKKDGKFSHELFENFLKRNGINEEKYVGAISNEVVATMIMQTMSMVAPLNDKAIIATENYKKEQRVADVITISARDIKSAPEPKEEEIEKFFSENKKNYDSPELRQVSYLTFSKKDFTNDLVLKEEEIVAEYEKNKDQYKMPEKRNFYHILFDKEEEAKSFEEGVKADKSKMENEFLKLAKEKQKKDKKAIAVSLAKQDLIPDLAETVFKMNKGELSSVLSSPLGYHVFLLLDIKPEVPMSYAQVKENIKKQLLKGREEKVMQTKITEIDDLVLSSNSLSEVAKKFNLKVVGPEKIDQNLHGEKGEEAKNLAALSNFSQTVFSLKKDQISKIIPVENSDLFYLVKVENIEPARSRELKEIRSQLVADLLQQTRQKMTMDLAAEVAKEVKENPNSITQIAAKHKLKLEKNREFPRIYYVDYQGQKIPYQNKFLDELFAIKIGETTSLLPSGVHEFVVGVLREIKKSEIKKEELENARKAETESFMGEVMREFNSYLLKKHPVKVNEKILGFEEKGQNN